MAAAAEATRLLERDSVLGNLRDALGEAAARRGRFVLVAGEAGVGKSAAVRAFCAEARHAFAHWAAPVSREQAEEFVEAASQLVEHVVDVIATTFPDPVEIR